MPSLPGRARAASASPRRAFCSREGGGRSCTLECEAHIWAPGTSCPVSKATSRAPGRSAISCVRAASERYGRRCHGAGAVAGASAVVACRPATALLTGRGGLYPDNVQKTSRNTFSAGLQRCGLSKSATKARIEPERARRIVDIPRFSSRPIPPRGAFVADLDTPPPRVTTGAPLAPRRHPRITFHERNRSDPHAAESGARRRPYRPRWRRRSSGRASTASATSSASGSPPRPAACCPGIMP